MTPLGKRIIVFTMMWVLLVMSLSQVYDNITGRGMPAPAAAAIPTLEPTVQPDEAVSRLADLQTCVASDPNNLGCVTDLASLYYSAGQYGQAQVNYERAVKLDPHNVDTMFKLAGTYIYQEKFPQAVPALRDAVVLKPDAPEIHLLLGLSLSKLSPPHMDEALTEWRKVQSLAPGSAWAGQAAQYISDSATK